jgi:hypothetical protein
MSKYTPEIVSSDEIHRIFNDNCYVCRLQAGELRKNKLESVHVRSRKAAVPVCSHSQIIEYLDNDGNRVALVHQYRLRDGTLGASGQPDPKWLLHEGKIYIPKF